MTQTDQEIAGSACFFRSLLEEAQAYLDRILGARKGGRSDSRKIRGK